MFAFLMLAIMAAPVSGTAKITKDDIKTPSGNIEISFIGHGSLMFAFGGKMIYVDPVSKQGDYSKMPKADIILITHGHPDHLDTKAIDEITKDGTQFIVTNDVNETLKKGTVMKNGDTLSIEGIQIEAVPAYNTTADRDKFHPKGRDNGYILTMGGKRIYVAGDTENTPEMASLQNIDVAFLPMNQPYTMTPEQVADAAQHFHPKILYPYHTGDTDISQLTKLMKKVKGTEVRVRPMK